VGPRHAFGRCLRGAVTCERRTEPAASALDIAEPEPRPIGVEAVRLGLLEGQQLPVGAFGGGEIAGLEFKPAVSEQALGIFWIEQNGARIGCARALRIAQAGDCAEITPRDRGLLAVLPDACLRLRNGRRLFIGNRVKQFRGAFDIAGLEQVERLLQARIARAGACGNVRYGDADRLLAARCGRRLARRDELACER